MKEVTKIYFNGIPVYRRWYNDGWQYRLFEDVDHLHLIWFPAIRPDYEHARAILNMIEEILKMPLNIHYPKQEKYA